MNYKTEADLLVEAGYCLSTKVTHLNSWFVTVPRIGGDCGKYIEDCIVDPYNPDSLESRRQCCALIEYFRANHNELWVSSKELAKEGNPTWWEHAVNRLKYCVGDYNA